ncbi:MAG: hypothetical protein MUE98_00330 [Rhodobacteraceae bacterium]|jgi:hypothetical protein|nr:hypothetical protein [Paracoccaceae bacterium]
MKRLTLTAALLLGTASAASATMETAVIDGCVVIPIAGTAGTAWQKIDPNCGRWMPSSGPRAAREVPDDDEDPDDDDDGEDPGDDPKDCPPKDDEPETPKSH